MRMHPRNLTPPRISIHILSEAFTRTFACSTLTSTMSNASFLFLAAFCLLAGAVSAATLRGTPDVVMASMDSVVKETDAQIAATEKDLEAKKSTFKDKVVGEKKIIEKLHKVDRIAKDCIKTATQKRDDANNQVKEYTAKLIPQSKIDFVRAGLEAAQDAVKKHTSEFKAEEDIFHHDMHHLEAVKNESTRILNMMNSHFGNKQDRYAGGGLIKPSTNLDDADTLDDLLPNKARGHIKVGISKAAKEKKLAKKVNAHAPAVATLKRPHAPLSVPKGDSASVVALLEMAQHNRLGDFRGLIERFTPEEKEKASTNVPFVDTPKNVKFHKRSPSKTTEDSVEGNINEESRAEKARSKDDGEVRQASGDKVPANNSTAKEASASKLKLRALGKQVKVGKDVGGHVIAAMAKLHAFISDHSTTRETAFELGTKGIRKDLAHAKSEVSRLTAIVMDYRKTNSEIRKNIDDFKALVKQNQIQIDQASLTSSVKLGVDANTKIGHTLADLKHLTSSYKNIVGDFKNEKSTARYVLRLVKEKLAKLRKYLETAKKKAAEQKKVIAEKFVDPALPKYKGLKDALKCDPTAGPSEWCKSEEMMVRCGVTKESCDTYNFKKLAVPPHMVPEGSKATKEHWKTASFKDFKKGNTVDARSEVEKKVDLTPDEQDK